MARQADRLLSAFHSRGVRFWVENDRLRFQAPRGVLAPEDLQELRERKQDVIALLGQQAEEENLALQPRADKREAPLTATQLRWWRYVSTHQEGMGERLVYSAVRASGTLDVQSLARSLDALQVRHEALRTRFPAREGGPAQLIDVEPPCKVELVDLSSMPPAAAEAEALRLAEQFVLGKVRLSTGPLLAAKLFRLSDAEHMLVLALEHIITDIVSNEILSEELWLLYQQAVSGVACRLPGEPLQFGDYAEWQQRTYESWLRKHAAYWRARLAGARRTMLPVDDTAEAMCGARYKALDFQFDRESEMGMRRLAAANKTMLVVVVLTVYAIAISRWLRQRDLILGFVSNGRYYAELQNVVGFLANVLYLRVEVRDDDTFESLLRCVDDELRSAYEHHDFDRVPDLVPECATELTFNWLSSPRSRTERKQVTRDLWVGSVPFRVPWPRKFLPVFRDSPDGLTATVTYQVGLFSDSTLPVLAQSMQQVAQAAVHTPHVKLLSLCELSVS